MKKFSVSRYKELLKTKIIGRDIIHLKEVDSTNNYALYFIKKKKIKKSYNGTVIIAETQKRGRGRQERLWVSPPGGLWFTIMLEAGLEEKKLPEITLIAAYSAASVLNKKFGIRANIKWPNDIYYCSSKLGGILTEAERIKSSIFLIVGMGINVNNSIKPISSLGTNPTSTRIILGKEIERENLLSNILYEFENQYDYYLKTEDFNSTFDQIKKILNYDL
ncbi:MAG: biotin--[acetyl-CoA-carboxylase] ligase [Actinomycetota bacterium]|nr:biotin--[acetyl-CoA-carboxylase] ligase [Actinomycetota bacterium]